MIKKILIFSVILAVLAAFSPVSAAKPTANYLPEVAEENGVYDVPGRPDMKVRVFVHKARPEPSEALALSCDLPDPDSSAVTGAEVWRLPSSAAYKLNTASVPSLVGGGNLSEIVGESFAEWTAVVPGYFTISNAGTTSKTRQALDFENIITWGRTSGTALATTYIWYYTATKMVADVDTIMNKKFVWSWSDPDTWPSDPEGDTCAFENSYDAQNIMIHELGHWFGLDDEYDTAYANNTMYGYGAKKETKKDTLTAGDKAGLDAIY